MKLRWLPHRSLKHLPHNSPLQDYFHLACVSQRSAKNISHQKSFVLCTTFLTTNNHLVHCLIIIMILTTGWEHYFGWQVSHQVDRLWFCSLHGGREEVLHILWNNGVLFTWSLDGKQVIYSTIAVIIVCFSSILSLVRFWFSIVLFYANTCIWQQISNKWNPNLNQG